MLVRIVKMTFKKESIVDFQEILKESKHKIRAYEGCLFLELLQDKANKKIFFTYSHWKDERYLDHYRNSDFFKGVWAKVKPLFAKKPEAWSMHKIESINCR